MLREKKKAWEKKKFVENDEKEWDFLVWNFELGYYYFIFSSPDEEFEESKRKGKMINIKVGGNDWSQLVFGGLCLCP